LDPSPTEAFFSSTKVPMWAPGPIRVPGRSRANGPTLAPGPISAD